MQSITALIKEQKEQFQAWVKEVSPKETYPGVPGAFVCTKEVWDRPYENYLKAAPRVRWMEFESVTDNSSIENFMLQAEWNGSLALLVLFRDKGFSGFLTSQGIHDQQVAGSYFVKSHEEMIALFRIVSLYNEIPASYFYKVRTIVLRGCTDRLPAPVR
jgi:hypothetical protein